MTLELPSEIYEAVKKAASNSGKTPANWIASELPRLLAAQVPSDGEDHKPAASLYHLHEHAIDTGISDLAEQHDHYIYGVSKHDD
ncbi:MAG TPA: hypothetical protein VGK87_09375 [Anaerolineae bacterium]